MKAMSMPPSDPRVRQMNDAQWLFCYFNQMEDEKEDAENWKSRFDYLTWFINYEMAKSVSEHNERNKPSSKESGYQGPRYQTQDLHRSTDFERETLAAKKGYDPNSDLTVDEFLAELEVAKENKEVDIANDDFETLLASGEFREIADTTQGVGNPNESLDEFITRALMLEEQLENQAQDTTIGLEQEHLNENNGSFNVSTEMEHDFNNHHNNNIINDDDLDIFEVDDD